MALDNPVILVDEPTANLDLSNSQVIADILRSLAADHRKLVIAVTHDPLLAECADRRLFLNGFVLEETPEEDP